ncbi:MAG: AEC family transporter [Candidatus Limiplasma sp.]|nr:AEC family transporter [Candidatus Limiplasma sp.]
MPVDTLVGLLVKITVMVLLSFVLKKTGIIDARMQKGLSELLMRALLPFSVLASANSEFSAELAGNLAVAAVVSIAYYIGALAISLMLANLKAPKGPLIREEKARAIFATMSVFANTGFLGLPLVKALYGTEGFLYGVVYNMAYQLFLFTAGVMLLSGEKKIRWKSVLGDLATLASVAAIAVYVSPFRFPPMLGETFEEIGNMCVPLSMMVVGCSLADIRPKQLLTERLGLAVSLLRLLVFPLGMLLILKGIGLSGILAASCVLLTALPVGSLNVVMAEKYRADVKLATCAVMQSMVLFVPSLPVILACVHMVLQ